MKKKIFIAALLLTTARISVGLAAPVETPSAPIAATQARPVQLAHDFFDGWRGERHRHHHGDRHGAHHGEHERAGDRPADPNAADAPVPNNGVFNGKARPKVEVQ